MGLGTVAIAAAIVGAAGVASAEVPLQPVDNGSQQNADISEFGSGSAAGSGHAIGSFLGQLLFQNPN